MAFKQVYPDVYVDLEAQGHAVQRIEMDRTECGMVAGLRADYVPIWIPQKEAEDRLAEVRDAEGD